MGSSQVPETFTILDSRGITRVEVDANGQRKEIPMTREEYNKLNPKHRDSNCTECTFVQDADTLLAFMVPREKRDAAGDRPEFVGKFTMPDWMGHSGFYLFKCEECEKIVVDYPHGYHGELVYLRCSGCGSTFNITDPAVYERESLHVPWSVRLTSLSGKQRFRAIKGLADRFAKNFSNTKSKS